MDGLTRFRCPRKASPSGQVGVSAVHLAAVEEADVGLGRHVASVPACSDGVTLGVAGGSLRAGVEDDGDDGDESRKVEQALRWHQPGVKAAVHSRYFRTATSPSVLPGVCQGPVIPAASLSGEPTNGASTQRGLVGCSVREADCLMASFAGHDPLRCFVSPFAMREDHGGTAMAGIRDTDGASPGVLPSAAECWERLRSVRSSLGETAGLSLKRGRQGRSCDGEFGAAVDSVGHDADATSPCTCRIATGTGARSLKRERISCAVESPTSGTGITSTVASHESVEVPARVMEQFLCRQRLADEMALGGEDAPVLTMSMLSPTTGRCCVPGPLVAPTVLVPSSPPVMDPRSPVDGRSALCDRDHGTDLAVAGQVLACGEGVLVPVSPPPSVWHSELPVPVPQGPIGKCGCRCRRRVSVGTGLGRVGAVSAHSAPSRLPSLDLARTLGQ